MVLVRIGRKRGQDRRIDLARISREQCLIAEVHQGLVGVVMQEFLDIFRQSHAVIERFRVANFVVVELQKKFEGKILDFLLLFSVQTFQPALELITDIIAMHCLIADDKPDEIGRVGELCAARPVHRQIEARIEQKLSRKTLAIFFSVDRQHDIDRE